MLYKMLNKVTKWKCSPSARSMVEIMDLSLTMGIIKFWLPLLTKYAIFWMVSDLLVLNWTLIHKLYHNLGFDRPKRLLMFINPFGGGKNGKKIFDDKIKAMLELARVEFTVIVTERANHAKDMILDQKTDLNKFDGIVCVGGDGMFGEVLNGVLVRTQRENQIDYSSVDCVPKKPAIKLGVIPAGSTDAVVYATCGNKNPTNSIISILLGRKINIDVGAVHDHGGTNLIRYTASFMGYGFFGDTIHDSEQNRWLGTKRYDWAGLKKFFNHRLYNGEIKLCIEPSDGSPKDFNPCRTK